MAVRRRNTQFGYLTKCLHGLWQLYMLTQNIMHGLHGKLAMHAQLASANAVAMKP